MDYIAILSRKLNDLFPDRQKNAEARRILDTYGTAGHEREPARVRLAVLKLSGADLEKIKRHISIARQDFRDVLASAEYPGQDRKCSMPDDRDRQQLIQADREEYEAWLNS